MTLRWHSIEMIKSFSSIVALLLFVAPAHASDLPICGYEVVHSYPHDQQAFTQGLLYRDGHLFESTGLKGQSTIRKVRLEDGEILAKVELPPTVFGEGLTDWKSRLISVTWRSGEGFQWDIGTLQQTGTFKYSGEGWGLTNDGMSLILSDGTPTLRFIDPENMQVTRTISVTVNDRPIANLNELEWVNGEIFANVWQSNFIVRIDPANGKVKAVIDLTGLHEEFTTQGNEDVLNGIAYDNAKDRLFVTGKNWPKLFEIEIVGCAD
jgi:glutamine cyclotransferase